MCFSLFNLVSKITNKRDTWNAFAVLIHSGTIMTAPHMFGTKIIVYPNINICTQQIVRNTVGGTSLHSSKRRSVPA